MKYLILFLLPLISFASVMSAKISGTVVSFDTKTVVLQQKVKKVSLPKRLFEGQDLKVGTPATTKPLSQADYKEIHTL